MRTKEQIEKEIKALQQELKTLDEKKFERVITGKAYYSIDEYGNVYKIIDTKLIRDDKCFDNYNYFLTKEQAEKVANKQKILNFMEKWNYEFDNGYEFIAYENNYKITFNMYESKNEYITNINTYHRALNTVYFSSEEKAEQCLEDMKKAGLL